MSTCIITGASSGIGRATTIQISKLGSWENIIAISRNESALMETVSLSKSSSSNIIPIVFDISNIDRIPELISDIKSKYGNIGCLLNIAGYTDPQPLLSCSNQNIRDTYATNVFAPLVLIRECVRYMKSVKSPKKIINIASTAGMSARPGWISYASSKAALISISQTLTEELREYGIQVYCVSPGRCATPLRVKLAPEEDPTTIMQPDEVANVILKLVHENEKCLDGQNIIIRRILNK
jgi:short-subunit dehydrogenase